MATPIQGMVPPGGWHFKQGDVTLEGDCYANLIEVVSNFRAENNLPQNDVTGDVNSYICGNWPHFCHGVDAVSVVSYLTPTTGTQLMNDVQAWAKLVLNSNKPHPLVLDELAEARAQVCEKCPKNLNWRSSCSSCVSAVDRLSAGVRQGRDVKSSVNLGGCFVMRHDNRSAVFLDRDALNKAANLPADCWVNVLT